MNYIEQINALTDSLDDQHRLAALSLGTAVTEAFVRAHIAGLPEEAVLQVLDLTRAQFVHATSQEKVAA